jgi:hypothetical protein
MPAKCLISDLSYEVAWKHSDITSGNKCRTGNVNSVAKQLLSGVTCIVTDDANKRL